MSEQAARECEDALQASEELDCLLDEKGAASRAGGMLRSLGCPSWFRDERWGLWVGLEADYSLTDREVNEKKGTENNCNPSKLQQRENSLGSSPWLTEPRSILTTDAA